ncbi:MAG: hypothetical protein ACTSPV_16690 [Candidatus Hodarchaeales archaeon]
MVDVKKNEVPILFYLWECRPEERNARVVSDHLNLNYWNTCNIVTSLIDKGAFDRIRKGKRVYYTKPLKGFMYEALRILTSLPISKCATEFDSLMTDQKINVER